MPLYSQCLSISPSHQTLAPALRTSTKGLVLSPPRYLEFSAKRYFEVLRSIREQNECSQQSIFQKRISMAPYAVNFNNGSMAKDTVKKRKIVEHIFLLKAKSDLSEEEEKDMLDYQYTSQYQMSGIIAISLGRIADPNVGGFTHAVYMRFQKKEDLTKFYNNSYYSGVLKEHVIPFCYVCSDMDGYLWIMNLK